MAKNLNRSLTEAAKKSIHERREKGESEAPKPHGPRYRQKPGKSHK